MTDHSPNGYEFEVGGGRVIFRGKPYWRDCLVVSMSRRWALDTIELLARKLRDDDQVTISIGFRGWLEQDEMGNWPFEKEQGE